MEAQDTKPKKRGRKKKDLDINIDTNIVDVSIKRTAGVTDVEIDTPLADIDVHKEPGVKAEIDITANPLGIWKFLKSLVQKRANK